MRFESALNECAEPSCALLLECQEILQSEESSVDLRRLIGRALDRWGISKEELAVRNRLCQIDLMSVDL
jgi:hypothetical protein